MSNTNLRDMFGNIPLTDEQQAIIDNAQSNAVIIAFAGTGKTTTLIELSKRRPHKKFLYLAYNNSIAKDSSRKFPKNVECKTINSFAYHYMKERYKEKFKNNISVYDINKIMNNENKSKFIYDTLKRFFRSGDEVISEKHINRNDLLKFIPGYKDENNKLKKKDREARSQKLESLYPKAVTRCNEILKMIFDQKNTEMCIDHEGCLKLFSIEFSNKIFSRYDCILFDEAQDSNEVIFYILKKSKIPVIAVGDAHQSIYAFRGSINSLTKFNGDIYYLSQSFRFGGNVASLANKLLGKFKKEKVKIRGNKTKDLIVYQENPHPETFTEEMRISRTNSGLIENAIECLENELAYHIVGGFNKSLYKTIKSIIGLSIKRKEFIEDEIILDFFEREKTLKELREYALENDDMEIKSALTVFQKYGIKVLDIIRNIKNNNKRQNQCQLWLSTAHKSKGLEADKVVLSNDFKTFSSCKVSKSDSGGMKESKFQEINILYVAVTRAKKYLYINDNLYEFLESLPGGTDILTK